MPAAGAPQTVLAQRLAVTTAVRLAMLTVLLAAAAFFYLGGALAKFPFTVRVLLVTIGGAYALAGVYAAWLRSGQRLRELATMQIVLDQVTWTALVYVSGGPSSGATSFYALTCLVAALLLEARGAAIAAATGLALYSLLCAGFQFAWIASPPDQPFASYATTAAGLGYSLLVNVVGVIVVAVLAGYLAERLRRTGGALIEVTARVREAERLAELGKIAAWLAHEIRNPLGSIRGSIEMLRESDALSDEDKRLCDIVQRETIRLNDLVSDMLDLSKDQRPKPRDVDVAKLAREIVSLASRTAGDVSVSIDYEGPSGAALARCDGAQMRQVLWNLVRNAIQASPAGGRVEVAVVKRGDRTELVVKDTGPGIGEEARPKIFEAFYTTRSHGAGIGLAVVKRIIDVHAPYGASIAVESGAAGGGATFRVALASVGGSAEVAESEGAGAVQPSETH
jgi:signal transduction histidine kinase